MFHSSTNDPTRIGDEIRDAKDTPVMKHSLGSGCHRNVGTLHNKSGTEPFHINFMQNIRAGGGNPDLTLDVNNSLAVEPISPIEIHYASAPLLYGNQRIHVDPRRVGERAARIRNTNKNRPTRSEKAGSMPANRAEALNCDTRPAQFQIAELARDVDTGGEPEAGRADLIERNASKFAG